MKGNPRLAGAEGNGLNENQIVVYQPNDTMHLDVRLENETVWLTQEQMALLFGRDQSVIARHVGNIFKEGELSRDSVYAKNAYTASDGKTYQVKKSAFTPTLGTKN